VARIMMNFDWQGGYDQSDLPDVIILLKVIVSLFC